MLGNKAFRIALLISVTAHGSLLAPWPHLTDLFKPFKEQPQEQIEINYLKITVTPKEKIVQQASQQVTKVPVAKIPEPVAEEPVPVKQEIAVLPQNLKLEEGAEELKGVYLDYYNAVREKIKMTLLSMYRPTKEGEIYLEFTLDPDGTLLMANILDEKSATSKELRAVTLKGLKKASPFPSFPDDVAEPQIDFNILISFRE